MTQRRDRLLLASIHDVSPRFESEVDGLLDLLAPSLGYRLAMLVVPDHWSEAPLIPGSAFATKLRGWAEQGVEMFVHGFTHRGCAPPAGAGARFRARWMTAGEGEFLGITTDDATARIRAGRKLLEDCTGHPIAGFIAPAWLYGRAALSALHESRISIAEDHFRVWSPATGRQLASGPVITWAGRSRSRLLSSLLVAPIIRSVPLRTLRVGVHPPDIHHPALVRSIKATMAAAIADRRPGSYAELLD